MTALATVTSTGPRRRTAHGTPARALRGHRRPHAATARYRGGSRPQLFLAYLDVDALPGSLDRVPGLVGPSPRAGALPAPRLPRRRRPVRSATRCATSSSERLGRRPTGPSSCSRTCARSDGSSIRSPSTTAGRRRRRRSTRSCSRSQHAVGRAHWYVFDARHGEHTARRRRRCTSRRSSRWTSSTASPGPRPATTCTSASTSERDGTPIFDAELALHRVPLDRRHAVTHACLRYPLLPLRVSIAIYREALRCSSGARPFTVTPPEAKAPVMTDDRPTARAPALRPDPRRHARVVDPHGTGRFGARGRGHAGRRSTRASPSTTRASTRACCAKAASASASRTPTAGGTPTTSPRVLRLAHRSLNRTHRGARPDAPARVRPLRRPDRALAAARPASATGATSARTTTSATTCSSACSTTR